VTRLIGWAFVLVPCLIFFIEPEVFVIRTWLCAVHIFPCPSLSVPSVPLCFPRPRPVRKITM
jgi:hypothetical protein